MDVKIKFSLQFQRLLFFCLGITLINFPHLLFIYIYKYIYAYIYSYTSHYIHYCMHILYIILTGNLDIVINKDPT